jgi:hypothetical protein
MLRTLKQQAELHNVKVGDVFCSSMGAMVTIGDVVWSDWWDELAVTFESKEKVKVEYPLYGLLDDSDWYKVNSPEELCFYLNQIGKQIDEPIKEIVRYISVVPEIPLILLYAS